MLKEVFWNTFKNSGNIEAYIIYKELDEYNKKNAAELNIKEVNTEIS